MRPRNDGREGFFLEGVAELEIADAALQFQQDFMGPEFDEILQSVREQTRAYKKIAREAGELALGSMEIVFGYQDEEAVFMNNALTILSLFRGHVSSEEAAVMLYEYGEKIAGQNRGQHRN